MTRYAVKTIKETLDAANIGVAEMFKADRTRPISARNMGTLGSGFLVEKSARTGQINVWYTSGTLGYYIPNNLADMVCKVAAVLEGAGYAVDLNDKEDGVVVYC